MLRAFLGLVVAWTAERALGPEPALWLGTAVGLGMAAWAWRGGRVKLMDLAVPVLVATAAIARTVAGDAAEGWGGVLVFGGLAAVAAASVVGGRPFTAAYGRERSPPALHGTAAFRALHRTMSLAWAAAFAALAVWSRVSASDGWPDTALLDLVPAAVLVAGDRLSDRFATARLAHAAG